MTTHNLTNKSLSTHNTYFLRPGFIWPCYDSSITLDRSTEVLHFLTLILSTQANTHIHHQYIHPILINHHPLGEKLELLDSFAFMTMITALNLFIFILTSSYLANLATVLFESSIPPPPLVVNADSANANYQSLCALASPTSIINPYNTNNPIASFVNGKFPLISVLQKPYPGNTETTYKLLSTTVFLCSFPPFLLSSAPFLYSFAVLLLSIS